MTEHVICHHCKKPIESKADLIVMRKWWVLPRPLHKQCWGDLFLSKGGLGTISFQTGIFQSRKNPFIPINSALFTIVSIIAFIIGLFILFAVDFSAGRFVVGGVERALTLLEILGLKAFFFVLFSVPLIQRLYSYKGLEKKLQ